MSGELDPPYWPSVVLQPWVRELAESLEEAGVVKADDFLRAAQCVVDRNDRKRFDAERQARANRKVTRPWWRR